MTWATKKFSRSFNQFFTIKEYDDVSGYVVKNVSGYTVTLKAKMNTTLLISGACSIASGSLGYIYYTVNSGDFPYTGKANYEIELVKGNERILTETYPLHIGRSI